MDIPAGGLAAGRVGAANEGRRHLEFPAATDTLQSAAPSDVNASSFPLFRHFTQSPREVISMQRTQELMLMLLIGHFFSKGEEL